jgi:hypothetical protein
VNRQGAQAMSANVWPGGEGRHARPPVRGSGERHEPAGNVRTRFYDDFAGWRRLGRAQSTRAPLRDGEGGKVDLHRGARAAQRSGPVERRMEVWIDSVAQPARDSLNWLGSYASYGINAVMIENAWPGGAPGRKDRDRHFDNFVVSTKRIGC